MPELTNYTFVRLSYRMITRTFCIPVVFICCALQAQSVASNPSEALERLQQASRRYADAKSFHIEEVVESNTNTELSRHWEKKLISVTVESDNRYRYEVRSPTGSTVRVSDGKIEWVYHVEDNAFTRKPAPADGPAPPQMMNMAAVEEFHAIQVRKDLADFAQQYRAAESQPDETIEVGGRQIACYVVQVGSNGAKTPPKPGTHVEKTVWIAKNDFTIRKIVTHQHLANMMAPAIFDDTDITELFPTVELNGAIAASAFVFTPPATATAVEQFSNPFSPRSDLKGKSAPPVTFQSADGTATLLASFRGKPVLLDFWATWCLPCVASMPEMAKIYQQTKEKGLAFVSIDEDTDAKTAADFLAKKHEPWPNYHDDGEIGKAFQKSGIPLIVLIDGQGKIVYYNTGYGDSTPSDLRAAIAALGPEYASINALPAQ
jgi:thiol-disulfide isomerase/thioredoxin